MRRLLSRLFRRAPRHRPIVVFPPAAELHLHPVKPTPPPNHVEVHERRERLDQETRSIQQAFERIRTGRPQ